MVAASAALMAVALVPSGASASSTCDTGGNTGGIGKMSVACLPSSKAKIVNGYAVAPKSAPAKVRRVIAAANKIRKKPYIWGGGHRNWNSAGYDCSGAVSYALRGGRFLSSPLDSSSLMSWEKRGAGKWITVFANGGHVYAVIAGLRWDTSMTGGNGPRWSKVQRSSSGFVARHPARF